MFGIAFWAVVLGTFAFYPYKNDLSSAKRFVVYFIGIPVVAFIVGSLAGSDEAANCTPDAGDCDLARIAGIATAAVILGTGVCFAFLFEAIRAVDHWQRNRNPRL